METKKENPIKPSGSLLIKIFAGYTILALLVIGIIAALWHEKKVFAEAEAEENAMLAQRELTSRTFKALVSLFLDNESAYLRDISDQKEYNEKENRVFFMLDELRKVYTDSLQQARIDTVEFLLNQKHDHIRSLKNIPSVLTQMDSILSSQLPVLERKMTSSATILHTEPPKPEKKNFLSRLFPGKGNRKKQKHQYSKKPDKPITPITSESSGMKCTRYWKGKTGFLNHSRTLLSIRTIFSTGTSPD